MAFSIRDLSVLAYANGFTLWHYKHGPSLLAHARADGFFSDACDMMASGDMIVVSGEQGGDVLFISLAGQNGVNTAPLTARAIAAVPTDHAEPPEPVAISA